MRRKPVEDPADLKKTPKEPVIDDLSDSEIGEASRGEKDPAVGPGSAGGRKHSRRTVGKRPAKKVKAVGPGPRSITKTLAEDADRESDHAYGGDIEVVEVLVKKPDAPENLVEVVAPTYDPNFQFKTAAK